MAGRRRSERQCEGTNIRGEPCAATPLLPGTTIEGTTVSGRWCRQHDLDLPGSARLGGATPGGGRTPVPKVTEVVRGIVERNVEKLMGPHFRALGFDLVRGEDGEFDLVELPEGGAKLHGTSKDGVVRVSGYDDLGAMIAATEKLLDRAIGRPRQAIEHSAPDGPALNALVLDEDLARDARDVLRRAAGRS